MCLSDVSGDSCAMKALVAVSSASLAFDKLFSYIIPGPLVQKAVPGVRVIVPFGRGNRKRVGLILETLPLDTQECSKLKSIISAADSEPVLNEEMLELIKWLKDNTFCTYYDAVKTMLPSGMNINIKEHYTLNDNAALPELSAEEKKTLEFLRSSPDTDSLAEKIKASGKGLVLESLIARGLVKYELKGRQSVGDSSVKMIKLTDEYQNSPENFKLTAKQKKLAGIISEHDEISVKEACYLCGCGDSVEKKLVLSGAAKEYEYEVFRTVDIGNKGSRSLESVILSPEQEKVFSRIKEQMESETPHCFLLHGVTGSGKTSVFEKLIGECISSGKQAILLIPEISLTPQTVRRFQELFGETVAVIHSGLSLGQRLDEYKRIRRGLAKIAIGTRSAVFAPLDNIGLIIVDEEGERSYKSDSSPRYNAIDVAKKRCRTHNAVLVLASATPSIESYYYARKGIYELLEMKKRYSGAVLPKVGIVDMNEERQNGNASEFSGILAEEINRNLENHEQTILLLNRRGYHTIISCCDCHKPVYCPNCSIPMTYHKVNGTMMCHYCGHSQPPAESCPECGSTRMAQMGFGTQKIEEQLQDMFPQARVLRMDADTTMSRYSYEKNFRDFGQGKYDIMIGTQMIGKGLDFPDVTLVGILSVDKALYAGDFRSYERTFSLAAQVVGRCGRGDKPGRAYLQTFMPDHYVLNLAAAQDYQGFYREEIAVRKALIFPPVCDICVIGISSEDDGKASSAAVQILEIIRGLVKNGVSFPLRVLGPVRCSYGKINGKFRYRLILKCKNTSDFRKFVREILSEAAKIKEFNNINVFADINGDIGI
ncbi:replication restart helicase PriA [Porcipelethomonas sp.]|uniref:replication restart helicase PriA n=1 Tax=Porcipelethomonas sp. TaxID=2981675 RepID=UPI003EF81E8A